MTKPTTSNINTVMTAVLNKNELTDLKIVTWNTNGMFKPNKADISDSN